MSRVFIGIGSNLGDRRANCRAAVRMLEERGIRVVKTSALIETEPWGVKEQPPFINMALEAETELDPQMLLGALKDIERALGRQETLRWGPRTVDLDILFYDDLVMNGETLRIPHPLLHARDFVLIPLAGIAPDKVHPILKKTIAELRRELEHDAYTDDQEQGEN